MEASMLKIYQQNENLLNLYEAQIKRSPFRIGTTSNNIIDIIKKSLDLTKYLATPTNTLRLSSLNIYRPKLSLLLTLLGYISQITAKEYQPQLAKKNKYYSITRLCLFGVLTITSFFLTAFMPTFATLLGIPMALIMLKINYNSLLGNINSLKKISVSNTTNTLKNQFETKLFIAAKQNKNQDQLNLLINQLQTNNKSETKAIEVKIIFIINKMLENHSLLIDNKTASSLEIKLYQQKLTIMKLSTMMDVSNLIVVTSCLLFFGSVSVGFTYLLIAKFCLDITEFINNINNYLNNEKIVALKNVQQIKQSKIYIKQTIFSLNFFKTTSILKADSDNINIKPKITL